jgi:uncharacterized protein (DUF2249 family)
VSEPPRPRQWREGADVHLDLRGLSPPQPLVSILRLLHALDRGTDLVVHLDRDPVMLYPELQAFERTAQSLAGDPGEVRLRLSTGAETNAARGVDDLQRPRGPA